MLDNSIILSILLSERHTDYKNRVLSFNTYAKWINFDNCINIREKINH